MRISLHAKTAFSNQTRSVGSVPLAVTIRPVSNPEGTYEYKTDSAAFLGLLRRKTDLSETAIQLFAKDLRFSATSRIPAVTFTDELLQEIGYYID